MARKFAYSSLSLLLFAVSCQAWESQSVPGLTANATAFMGYQWVAPSTRQTAYPLENTPEVGIISSVQYKKFSIFTFVRYDTSHQFNDIVPYANLTYSDEAFDVPFRIKGGRLRNEINLYGGSRYDPFARPGIILPQAIYFDALGTALTSGNGMSFEVEKYGALVRFSMTSPDVTNEDVESKTWTGRSNSLVTGYGRQKILYLKYTPEYYMPLTVIVSHTTLDLFTAIKGVSPEVEIINMGIEHWSGPWRLAAQALWFKRSQQLDWTRDFNKLSKGFSLTAEYEINDDFTVRLNYNEYLSQITSKVVAGFPDAATHARDYNVGLRYHHDNLLLGLEYHYVEGCRWLEPQVWSNEFSYWSFIAANAVYRFDLF